MVRWFLAIRRHTHARWYFFPIFNWYDLLSLIPVTALRPLRLLRVVSIYMRLRQSDLSRVGRDFLSRGVAYISNIITEEVSDRVAVRILDEYREEIVDGTHVRIARATVEPRRAEIERVLVSQIRAILTDEDTIERFRQLLRLNLANAVDESESLRSLPLPHIVVKPVVSTVGEVLLDTTLETITTTLDSVEGQEAVEALADSILEALFYGPALAELESLAKDISIQVIDHMKEVVVVKKWALPDEAGQATGDAVGGRGRILNSEFGIRNYSPPARKITGDKRAKKRAVSDDFGSARSDTLAHRDPGEIVEGTRPPYSSVTSVVPPAVTTACWTPCVPSGANVSIRQPPSGS